MGSSDISFYTYIFIENNIFLYFRCCLLLIFDTLLVKMFFMQENLQGVSIITL